MRHVLPALMLLLALTLAACASDEERPAGGEAPIEAGADPSAYAYEAFFAGALTDTLRGAARFGVMVDGRTGARRLVIALRTPDSGMGGLFLVPRRPELPEPGSHPLTAYNDSLSRPAGRFALVYRDGLLRRLSSVDGTLTFTTVRDTLLEGRFSARLRGTVVRAGAPLTEVQVTARGTFRAERGEVGFIVGI